MNTPTVSIIIPTYNRANLISEAIDSVLAQTYRNFEIIVVDDGSTDNTKEVLSKYNGQIKYIYQDNKGGAEARNNGIKNAQGEYIAFLDSDDLWLPNKLEKQVKYLFDNINISLIYSDAYLSNSENVDSKTLFDIVHPFLSNDKKEVLRYLFLHKPIYPSTVVTKRSCFDKVGLFNSSLRNLGEDYDMWLRIAKYFNIGYINEPLVHIRDVDKKACSNMEPIYETAIKTRKALLDSHPNFVDKNTANKFFSSAYYKLGCAQVNNNKIQQARINFLNSIKYFPWNIKKYFCLVLTFLPNFLLKKYKKKILNLFYGRD